MADDFSSGDIAAASAASGASPASDPSTTSTAPAASASAATTVPPAATEPPVEGSPSTGPIPFERHKAALENARKEAAEKAAAEFAWAKTLDRNRVQQLMAFAQTYQANPVETLLAEIAELQQNPSYAQQIRSFAARQLASARGQGPAQPSAPDMVRVQLEDGSVVSVPRDMEAYNGWLAQTVLQQAEARFKPALDTASEFKALRDQAIAQQQATEFAQTSLKEFRQLPQFKEHELEIKAKLAELDLRSDHPDAVTAAVYRLYHQIVLPKLQASERQSVLTDLQQKAHATTVNPAQTSTQAAKSIKEMSIAEALQAEYARLNGTA